jgi:ADP-ribosylglycohydrolase
MGVKMSLPNNYDERVYAGVLGKIIGVYLGRPFEGWSYERIVKELGDIKYYVHDKLNLPLIVTDDDITGTFTFLRALPDYSNSPALTPKQIGQSWLNYIIENRTILWWGGLGNSTEHTAFLRLKAGISAPESGSIALNSKVVAEQIGSQIFIDGWAMVCPGDPVQAVELARRASVVSHDGEAVYGAQVLAAMEAQAFVESDINKLIDVGVSFIPKDSIIYRMIADIRAWHQSIPDWRDARLKLEENYGYDKYGGNCHMVPNHGLIILSMLYGDDDFQKTMMIVNTCGWDTDCNSGNIGCLLGIKNGLAGLETGPDFRGPVADRIFLPTAEGGSAINDALTQSYFIINIGRALQGLVPVTPKQAARFHFSLPGSVQGFQEEDSVACKGTLTIENVELVGGAGERALALRYHNIADGRDARAATATFIPLEHAHTVLHYELLASPTIYPGQTVRARVIADAGNAEPAKVGLYIQHYAAGDQFDLLRGTTTVLQPGASQELTWIIPDLDGQPVAEIGVEISSFERANGSVYLDYLTWDGEPNVNLGRPVAGGTLWRKAWVNAIDSFDLRWPEPYRLAQNRGTGLISQGTQDWRNYTVESAIIPHLVTSTGIAARVQGLERYYALLLCADRKVRLVKKLDGSHILAEQDFNFDWDQSITFKLTVQAAHLQGWVNGQLMFDLEDQQTPLLHGAVALIVEEGRINCDMVTVKPN